MLKKLNIILCAFILIFTVCFAEAATPTDIVETSIEEEAPEILIEEEREIPHVTIRIWFIEEGPVPLNSVVHLCSEVIGGEGQILNYQWQFARDENFEWEDIPGATEPTYEFIITLDNMYYYYRLCVTHHWPREGDEIQ